MGPLMISVVDLASAGCSLLFGFLDMLGLLVFMDTFSTGRRRGRRYLPFVAVWWLAAVAWNAGYERVLGLSYASKILGLIALCYLLCRLLYPAVPQLYLAFLVILQYLFHYLYSLIFLLAFSALCGVPLEQFENWQYAAYYVISALVCYSSELGLVLAFRKWYRGREKMNLRPRQLALHFAFPVTSFGALVIFLRMINGKTVPQWSVLGCCLALMLANVAVFYLLRQTEQAAQDREKLVALNQQLQIQSAGMESARALYETQRKATHDFRAQLEVLGRLLQSRDYDAARDYLDAVSGRQSDRLILVDCRHPILNALFNTKAAAARSRGIGIRFEVNDLSGLPFDQADLTVLLANLLDNAIEACEKDPQPCTIEVRAILEENFFFSVRNPSVPVVIEENHIPTTKPNPELHGFGLPNAMAIVEKYHGISAMEYYKGWFQFAGELPV